MKYPGNNVKKEGYWPVWTSVEDSVMDSVSYSVRDSVEDSVWWSVGNSVEVFVSGAVEDELNQ